ncbi:hypothetical protein [Shewanella sp. GXUN23E]|uniref:hypothetical protein n=1 Tax=Shewanella sp. GXUN23E TaxID=3422498 RepID=UPI003D7D50DD
MLIDTITPIPERFQAQIDNTCDALSMVLTSEVCNVSPETALELTWVIHPTPSEAMTAFAGGHPCIISETLGLYATVS